MGEAVMFPLTFDHHESNSIIPENMNGNDDSWFEEVIDDDLKWSFALNRFHTSPFFSVLFAMCKGCLMNF